MRPPEGAKGQHWINFIHLGRKFYNLVLWSNSQLGQRKWLENIYQQQQAMRERSTIFETVTLVRGLFHWSEQGQLRGSIERGQENGLWDG